MRMRQARTTGYRRRFPIRESGRKTARQFAPPEMGHIYYGSGRPSLRHGAFHAGLPEASWTTMRDDPSSDTAPTKARVTPFLS